MTQELIIRIMEKAKAEGDHDYVISEAKVRQDLREAGELDEKTENSMSAAERFLHKIMFYPKTQAIFFAEKFETKSLEDYEQLFLKELEEKNQR